ncbi:DUF305 domain-containing protein [Temperatibacter marinus]
MTGLLWGQMGHVAAQDVPLVQPGNVGEKVKIIKPKSAIEIAVNSYTPEDVSFMQNMIPHHHQATLMSALVKGRTNRQELLDIAGKIDASQKDEISFMLDWLKARGERQPDPAAHSKMDMSHVMAGMASPAQMKKLASLEGVAFDKLFLELMIFHHAGAITMVKDLLSKRGSAYDPVLYEFVSDVQTDQQSEISRMNVLLASLSSDPRVGLKAGFSDAGEAALNMKLLRNLPRPAGFFDPENPLGLAAETDKEKDGKKVRAKRGGLMSFANTDMAFDGDKLVVGNYHGFNTYKLDAAGMPALMASVVCPGGQGDVSVIGDLLIMSVEETRGRTDCGIQGISEDVSADRFRGIRIFNISDYQRPVQVGQVQTCRGSHTHSIVSGDGKEGTVVIYNSGTSSVRDEKELESCIGNFTGDKNTALFRIDVIEIPVDDPSKARIVDSPAVFADEQTGALAGLWRGGNHGPNTQRTYVTNQCHDITVFPKAKLAAGACSGNGIILDISNPLKPKRIDAVVDPGFAYWHSATFNNDGTKVLFTDEWGGGGRPRCMAGDPKGWGANAIYDIENGKLEFKGKYKLPAPQTKMENCVAHNGSIVPVPGRDIFVQAWYQGGISVIDFSESTDPKEIAFFDRGPLDENDYAVGGYWSSYWYNGKVYGTGIYRGLDVFELIESDVLTANELAAAKLADQGEKFNPQQQFEVTWPDAPVVALAYLDQLDRTGAIAQGLSKALREALTEAQSGKVNAKTLKQLAKKVKKKSGKAAEQRRKKKLVSTMRAIAAAAR